MSMPAARAAAVSASRVHTAGPVASVAVSSPVSSRTSRPGGGLATRAISWERWAWPIRGLRPRRAGGRARRGPRRLRREPHGGLPEGVLALGASAAALDLRPARRSLRARPVRPVLDALADKLPKVAEHLEAARADVLAFTAFPKEVWRQISELQPQRTPQPGDPPAHRRGRHLPDRDALIRLVGAVPAEQHDEWTEARRYLGLDVLARCRLRPGHRPRNHRRGNDHSDQPPGAQRLTKHEDHAVAVKHHVRGLDRRGLSAA